MKIPTDLKDIKAIREFLTQVRTQVCGLADYLTEPWKTHFCNLKQQYDDALKALPPTDMVPAAQEASQHLSAFFSILSSANALATLLGTQLNSMIVKEKETIASGGDGAEQRGG